MRTGLVACAAQKVDAPTFARYLYTSPLFVKASRYCAREYDRWYVLSALHGVVHPDDVLAPYDVTLNTMPRAERLAWGEKVRGQLRALGLEGDALYLHAGARYREPFASMANVITPLAGLGIGRQLAWYVGRGIK